ncbi:zinc metalloprotease [Cryomyces antarcticus]
MAGIEKQKTHFKTVQKFKTDYAPVKIAQYESERTGMRVVVVDQKGPKVYGYFALATEIHDDSGSPHTLEHLCFMGSKSFRYKGVLDKLANRAYSSTNAWTATDHTAYTLDSAGWEGFAQILAPYLEHVLLPTLTDSGCYTEVHHIDGTGHDAGVVYSEMQGVQNDQSELMSLQARRLMYPEGNGFRYETGGMMEQLRVLTADRIREFHREMYQPKNLCLVLIGEVDHQNMLEILEKFEDGILDEVPAISAPFKRPWVESDKTPALKKTIVDIVHFPEDDESSGEVMVGFLGPDVNDTLLICALEILLTYLCGSSVSVLENTLVEKEALASQVSYYTETRPDVAVWLSLSSVATEKLVDVEKRLFQLLRETASKSLDMAYMRDCINRFRRQIKFYAESSGDFFSETVIEDHLYGSRDGSDLRKNESLEELDYLEVWTDEQWRKFLAKWLSDAHHVSILGVPSKALSQKLKSEEKARVKAQQDRLGEEGLKELERKLEAAKAENDKEIPREILEQFKIPGTDSIHFIPTTTARSGLAKEMGDLHNDIQMVIDKDEIGLPLFIHFEHIPSNFVTLKLIISTTFVATQLQPLLSLYLMNFLTTPVSRNGKKIEFEQVVTELEKDTISYGLAPQGSNPELLQIDFRIEPEKYEAAITWLRTMLFDSVFDVTRLKASVTKMLAEIPDAKRDGDNMAAAVNAMVHWSPESSSRARNILVKALYLKRIDRLLRDEPETVISQMESIRKSLCRFENFRVNVIANIETLAKPVSSWKLLTSSLDTTKPLNPLESRKAYLSDAARNPGNLAYIVPMPTIDSSFAYFTAKGPSSYDHPQLPALMVALSYLDAVEGPMWVAVRGTGLAYGSGFGHNKDTGLVKFSIYRSPDVFKAYEAAKKQVEGHISGTMPFDPPALDGAISNIVRRFADEQPTMGSAAAVSFTNQVIYGISKDWNNAILKQVRDVKVEQIKEVLQSIVLPVLQPASANLIVTCATIMEEDLVKNFKASGFRPEVRSLSSFQDDYGLKPKEGEDDAEDGEEEGEEDEGSEGSEASDDEDD